MKARTLPVAAILAAGVGMGSAGDYLLRAPGEPGLNVAIQVPNGPLCARTPSGRVSPT